MSDTDENQPSELGPTKMDRAVAVARGVAGMVPFAGPWLTELINEVVPNQRIDRLEAYARLLDERLSILSEDEKRTRFREPENVDLFEDGARQATRALSEDRKTYVANLVASGITGDEADRHQAKRLLTLLDEIDDAQIIILASHLHKNSGDGFFDRHRAVLEPKSAYMGAPQEELDEATLQEAARNHLGRLGLIKAHFRKPRPGVLPEFDENTGMMKVNYFGLTPLGRLLLRNIGLAGPDDF